MLEKAAYLFTGWAWVFFCVCSFFVFKREHEEKAPVWAANHYYYFFYFIYCLHFFGLALAPPPAGSTLGDCLHGLCQELALTATYDC